jgi:predicted O-linked N-acetylglucosamine transferase (SPINDLY family)
MFGIDSNAFVYCCFNNNYKITPEIFSSWMRILSKTENSILFIYVDTDLVLKNLRVEAEKLGVSGARIIPADYLPNADFIERCKVADLFLDTFPYNAGTTASDALWAGLPVLTCMGDSFASRIAASLLTAIELPELITRTQAEYEDVAIELATNPEKLKNIKIKLDKNRSTTALFNSQNFTINIENAYKEIYERFQKNLRPEHIIINTKK